MPIKLHFTDYPRGGDSQEWIITSRTGFVNRVYSLGILDFCRSIVEGRQLQDDPTAMPGRVSSSGGWRTIIDNAMTLVRNGNLELDGGIA